MNSLLCTIYLLLICLNSAFGNQISFLKYCTNGSNPGVLPETGAHSAGSLVMSTKTGSDARYLPDLNCSVTLTTESSFHILLSFSNISLRNSSMDNLTVIYDAGASSVVLAGQQVCSNEDCEGLKFESGKFNNLTLKFISANVTVPHDVTGFRAHYTVFDFVNPRTGACKGKNRFLCENKHCIWFDLTCNGHNDCGDLSDETKCIIPVKDTVWGILTIVIAVLAVVILVPLFCFLATYGTRSIVKTVTVENQPTLLSNAANCGETSGLLTSSEAITNCWPGSSDDRRYSFTYGSAECSEASTSTDVKKKSRSSTEVAESKNGFL